MLLCEIMTIFSWFILKAVTPWLEEKLASKPDDTATHQTLSHIQHIGYQASPKSNRVVSFSCLTTVQSDFQNRSKDISSLSSLNESDQGKLERLNFRLWASDSEALRTIEFFINLCTGIDNGALSEYQMDIKSTKSSPGCSNSGIFVEPPWVRDDFRWQNHKVAPLDSQPGQKTLPLWQRRMSEIRRDSEARPERRKSSRAIERFNPQRCFNNWLQLIASSII